jgi:integrase
VSTNVRCGRHRADHTPNTPLTALSKTAADAARKGALVAATSGLIATTLSGTASASPDGNARRAWFDQAVRNSGTPHGFHPHELRHTSASLAVSAGANVKALQRMLGHKKASMTLDVYADLFDDDLTAVAETDRRPKDMPLSIWLMRIMNRLVLH